MAGNNQQDLAQYLVEVQNSLLNFASIESSLNGRIASKTGNTASYKAQLDLIVESKRNLYTQFQRVTNLKIDQVSNVANSGAVLKGALSSLQDAKTDADELIEKYKDLLNQQDRMVEIATYERKKNESHRDILKVVAYTSILVLGLIFLHGQPWFPKLLGKILIIVVISYGLYLILGQLYWNLRREDKYWDKFQQSAISDDDSSGVSGVGTSRWEHNKKALSKLLGGVDTDLLKKCGLSEEELAAKAKETASSAAASVNSPS
tara:strand:- start:541 stop:1326 length:786 start_codon:yes stop_codon:yes gene_type:complete